VLLFIISFPKNISRIELITYLSHFSFKEVNILTVTLSADHRVVDGALCYQQSNSFILQPRDLFLIHFAMPNEKSKR